jgi:hypothetical protein
MSNIAWGVASSKQQDVLDQLKAQRYTTLGHSRGLPASASESSIPKLGDDAKIKAIVISIDPSAQPWPAGTFVR